MNEPSIEKLIGIDKDRWDSLTPAQHQKVFEALQKKHILSPGDRIIGTTSEPFVRVSISVHTVDSRQGMQYRSLPTMAAPSWFRPSKGWCDYLGRAGKIACASLDGELVAVGNLIVDLLHDQCLKLVKAREVSEQDEK